MLREREIVGRGERAAAEFVEGEARHAVDRLRNMERAAEQRDLDRRAARRAGQVEEGGVERLFGARVGGAVIDRRAGELLQPVVGAGVERDDVDPFAEQLDERQEQRAVEPVAIELVGRDVGGRHHHHAGGEQRGEQPAEDHRVGDVAHREFVEAEQSGVRRQRRSDRRDRLVAGNLADPPLLAPAVDAHVDVSHEGVKMDAALPLDRRSLEEQVHQQRFSAPNRAVDIEPARRRGRLAPNICASAPARRPGR